RLCQSEPIAGEKIRRQYEPAPIEPAATILHMEGRAVLRLAASPIVEAGGGDIGMSEPFLDLAMSASFDRAFVAAVALSECTHNPFTSADTGGAAVFPDDVAVDRTWLQVLLRRAGAVVLRR